MSLVPLGLYNYVGRASSPNIIIAGFNGGATASLSYYDTSWHTATISLTNNKKIRFATLGGKVFLANGTEVMQESSDGNSWTTTNCISTDSVKPSLLIATKGRMLAGGYSSYPDRVYFSSIISPAASPYITWNTNATTGDWIDINPDDGSNVTGFADIAGTILVFKSYAIYRLNTVSKTVDTTNIYNIGAPSQEAITVCNGYAYFFTGYDIRRTNGSYPEQISRLGVQDYIDAILPSNWAEVYAGNDGQNVYFSIGSVTLNGKTVSNVMLKFSTRDDTWSVHQYNDRFKFFTNFTVANDKRYLVSQDTSGGVQQINFGTTDNGVPINFFLETQDIEMLDRAATKDIKDKLVVFAKNGISSKLHISQDGNDYKKVDIGLNDRVNVAEEVDFGGRFVNFKWSGNYSIKPPQFEGIYIPTISNQGINK